MAAADSREGAMKVGIKRKRDNDDAQQERGGRGGSVGLG